MDVQFHLLLTVKDITGLLFLHLASKSFKIEFRAKIRAPIRATFTEGLGSCSPSLAQTCVGPWSGTLSYWDQKHPTLDCVRFLLILDLYIYIQYIYTQYIYIHSIYIHSIYIHSIYIYIHSVYIYTVYIYILYVPYNGMRLYIKQRILSVTVLAANISCLGYSEHLLDSDRGELCLESVTTSPATSTVSTVSNRNQAHQTHQTAHVSYEGI